MLAQGARGAVVPRELFVFDSPALHVACGLPCPADSSSGSSGSAPGSHPGVAIRDRLANVASGGSLARIVLRGHVQNSGPCVPRRSLPTSRRLIDTATWASLRDNPPCGYIPRSQGGSHFVRNAWRQSRTLCRCSRPVVIHPTKKERDRAGALLRYVFVGHLECNHPDTVSSMRDDGDF